jgi:L-arabinonolactonase
MWMERKRLEYSATACMSALRTTLVGAVEVGNTLGEGVLWDDVSQRLWWTDIQEQRLFRYEPVRGALETFELPERLGSFGFVEGSDRLIGAFESGFAYFQPESGRLDWVCRPPHAADNLRFNDGHVDRRGRFWAGSMVEGTGEPTAKLYCLCNDRAEVHLTGIKISNSVCFSTNARHMFFADSPQRRIYRFDIDPVNGALSNRKLFAQTPPDAFPDGSSVDAEGHLWNAHWGAGRVVRYAPDGSISGSMDLPVTQPTCVAFGGAKLDHLFITTAREHLSASALSAQPQAGHLFIYKTNLQGNPEPRYRP